jgi:hypothetical protein
MELSSAQEITLRRLVEGGDLAVEEIDRRTLNALERRGLVTESRSRVHAAPPGRQWVEENPDRLLHGTRESIGRFTARVRSPHAPRRTELALLRRLERAPLPLEAVSRSLMVRVISRGWATMGDPVELTPEGREQLRGSSS